MTELSTMWAALKGALIRALGREGAAEWLAFAALQMRAEARREVIDLRPTHEFRP